MARYLLKIGFFSFLIFLHITSKSQAAVIPLNLQKAYPEKVRCFAAVLLSILNTLYHSL
jgi:hypothetical protein